MNNYKFKRKELANRRIAFLFSIIFHLGLLGGIAYASTDSDWKDLLPQTVKEYFEMDTPEKAIPDNKPQA